ncbi:hypothetical protein EVJ58_g4623 [Rhodofomes roseus]|uniref:Uncharacterized protein n=1 Tax=Rhodofomes roseus TaxID=34475 RepID=A0A4Y9YFC8_9APHY|nr:hypothetical protein EVJ58_g4623 [Rhodofomes roseus]
MIEKVREQTATLVNGISAELSGGGHLDAATRLEQAWMAYRVSCTLSGWFGGQSFGWIALGEVFDAIRELNERTAEAHVIADILDISHIATMYALHYLSSGQPAITRRVESIHALHVELQTPLMRLIRPGAELKGPRLRHQSMLPSGNDLQLSLHPQLAQSIQRGAEPLGQGRSALGVGQCPERRGDGLADSEDVVEELSGVPPAAEEPDATMLVAEPIGPRLQRSARRRWYHCCVQEVCEGLTREGRGAFDCQLALIGDPEEVTAHAVKEVYRLVLGLAV